MNVAALDRIKSSGVEVKTDVAAEPLEQAAQQLRAEGFRVETHLCDISDEESVRGLAKRARTLGQLRGLVHTAGLSPTMASWQRIIQVDLVGTARLLQAFLPLAEPESAVVCVASMAGHLTGTPLEALQAAFDGILAQPLSEDLLQRLEPIITTAPSQEEQAGMAFSLAKYGVIRLCQRESSVWGARGARIVSLSPGITQTPMGQQEFDQQPMMASLVAPVVHSRAEARDRARIDAASLLSASLLSAPPPAGGVWGSYLVGAICGSALELHLALWALAFPLCVLAGLIVLDVLRPLQQPEASISQG